MLGPDWQSTRTSWAWYPIPAFNATFPSLSAPYSGAGRGESRFASLETRLPAAWSNCVEQSRRATTTKQPTIPASVVFAVSGKMRAAATGQERRR